MPWAHIEPCLFGGVAMRPARIIAIVVVVVAAATGSYIARSTATHPAAAPQPQATAPPTPTGPQPKPGPNLPPSTTSPSGGRPVTGRCAASALAASVQGSDGAAGHIWYRVQLRNTSARKCTVQGIPGVRLLGAQGQPVTAPSVP